ncbi:hypothetical protein [Leptolinea tardivitalis]|uniref:Pappalysin-1 SD scarf domain-containing protein n=1 Tax=Leptolinea tardivitalis TaxID=229920 RepID=A0A0P6WT63_9CHLR|nr:hypothetical protein [Leptolinea tardivitalis]KPL73435.1 hypothetical protein ADM99_04360 [Leptolinea tardivitalis]GAP21593.1 hypothetical protein LTAR_01804 [Leptolinea tardivitalis]
MNSGRRFSLIWVLLMPVLLTACSRPGISGFAPAPLPVFIETPSISAEPPVPTEPGSVESTVSPDAYDVVLPTVRPGEIRQWATEVIASSQYSSPDWAASQALGKPDVSLCGDNRHAWASKGNDTIEWIELTYDTPVHPTEINIYQNFNPSQVVEVQLTAVDGSKHLIWEGYPEKIKDCPEVMTIVVDLNRQILVNRVRITIDQRVLGWGWNEIDAVELVGAKM